MERPELLDTFLQLSVMNKQKLDEKASGDVRWLQVSMFVTTVRVVNIRQAVPWLRM
jgi:hypothetical protein